MNTQIQQGDYFSNIDIDQDYKQLQQPNQQPELKQKRQSRKGKQNVKGGNGNQFNIEDPNQGNMSGFVMAENPIYNNYQITFDSDKIQLEGQENDIGYANQNPNQGEYLNMQQQYQQQQYALPPQNIIEPVKQYNYNMQNYMSNQIPANVPFVDSQIGLINNYEVQKNQIQYNINNNPFYQYSDVGNQLEIRENIINQDNNFTNNEHIDNFSTPAPPLLVPTSSTKQKKPRNSSTKNSQNPQENPKSQSTTKKGKKAAIQKGQLELQENIAYGNHSKIDEEEDLQLGQLEELPNMDKQDFQIVKTYERAQNDPLEINTSIPSNQKRRSQQQQQLKEQSHLENPLMIQPQNSQQHGISINGTKITKLIHVPEVQNTENYSQNEYQGLQKPFQQQNIQNNGAENGLLHIHMHQQQQQQQQYIQIQQNEGNNLNEENLQMDQENDKFIQQQSQQQFIYNPNSQYIHGHGGIANQAYTFVSNEALGFENKQEVEDTNFEQKEQEIIYQYNNDQELALQNDQNINQFNYQGDDMQTPQLLTGKKKYSKKNNKNGNNTDAPPKKQREKKSSASDKSNATSSASTTVSMINQNQVDQQMKFGSEKINIAKENFALQIQQGEQIQEKIENIPPFQEETIKQQFTTDSAAKPAKEPKKRAQSRKKAKTSIMVSNTQEENDKQDEQQQQQSDPVIPNSLENVQEIGLKAQTIFGENNLMENLHKKVGNQQFQPRQVDQMWNNNQFGNYQQIQNPRVQHYNTENLGLQLDQSGNLMKLGNQSQQQEDQMQMGSIQKFHIDQRNQGEYQMMQHLHPQHMTQPSLTSIIQNDSYTNINSQKQIQQEMIIERNAISEKKIRQKDRNDKGMDIVEDNYRNISEKVIEEDDDEDDINANNNRMEMGLAQEEEEGEQLALPDKLSKKKSSKSSTKGANRKRKISSIHPEIGNANNNSNSDIENQNFNNNPTPIIQKEKSVNEKKRGIRDLTTEEKWDVFVQYDKLKSYRGVGRLFNMDHSTVKLLVHRIQNERPKETITKEIFLQSQIAQPSLEHSLSKKLKKEKQNQEAQQNANNSQISNKLSKAQSKSDKNSQQDPHTPQENIIQEQEQIEQEDQQIHLYGQDNINSQQQNMVEDQIKYQQMDTTQNITLKQESQIKIEEKIEAVGITQQEEGLSEVKIIKVKSKKESNRKQTQSKRRSSTISKSQTEIINDQGRSLQQIGSQNQIISPQLEYQMSNNQIQDLNQQDINNQNEKLQQNIKYEHEQFEGVDNYALYQNDNLNHYQNEIQQNQDNNDQGMPQQQQYHQAINQENIYGDLNDENKNGNHMNVQISLQEIEQNQIPPPLPEIAVRSKSSIKLTAEEKKANKEMRKQIKEQQKAQAKLEKPIKPKKGKGKGQQESMSQIQEYQQEMGNEQNYQHNNYDQNIYFNNGQENYYYQNFDPNYQYNFENTYQANKYEEDYDLNIDNLDINNQAQQQQQNNPQSYDNDEIKLELM